MTQTEFEELSFEEAIEKLIDEGQNITTYDSIKDYIHELVDTDFLMTASALLESLEENTATYYDYDFSCGGFDEPKPLNNKDDLKQYIIEGDKNNVQ